MPRRSPARPRSSSISRSRCETYTRDLDTRAYQCARGAERCCPTSRWRRRAFARLAEAERAGSLTGTAGSGTVVQLLTQMSTQLDRSRQGSHRHRRERVKALFEQGGKHLAKMRELVSDRGPITTRSDAFATESMVAHGRDRRSAADLGGARGEARRDIAVVGLHRAGRGRAHRRSRRSAEHCGRQGRATRSPRRRRRCAAAADKILALPRVEPAPVPAACRPPKP